MLSNIPNIIKKNTILYILFFVTEQHRILLKPNYLGYNSQNVDPDIIVGITTHCGLKGQEIETGGCEIFHTPPEKRIQGLSPGGLAAETRH
jgi:hypothetical protein